MKVYLLCQTRVDYLEIWEYTEIVGVFSSKALAEQKAKKLKLDEYTVVVKKVDK